MPYQAHIQVFKEEVHFWEESQKLVKKLWETRNTNQNFRIAASGGSSANLFDHLEASLIDFSKTEIWQVDERFISEDHPDSNTNLLKNKLAHKQAQYKFFPILKTPAESVQTYEDQLKPNIDGYLFDLTILGVGPDGHVASLFPQSEALDEEKKSVIQTQTDRFAIHNRLSLTFPSIKSSRAILVLMIGANKADIFTKINDLRNDFHDIPARKIMDWPQTHVHFLNT
jgi:6-phosphogluconolactonase